MTSGSYQTQSPPPTDFPAQSGPALTATYDPTNGALTDGTLTLPPVDNVCNSQGCTNFLWSEVTPGSATGLVNSDGGVTISDTLQLEVDVVTPIQSTCLSKPINVTMKTTSPYDPTSGAFTVTNPTSFTIPPVPPCTGPLGSTVAANLNPGLAGSTGNAMTLSLSGTPLPLPLPADPTTTTLTATPESPQLVGSSVTLSAVVAPTSGSGATPTGSVTFQANGVTLGTGTLDDTGTATFTTSALQSATYQLTAVYSGGPGYASSTSDPVSYIIQPTPIISANLPSTLTVPSASALPTVAGTGAAGIPNGVSPNAGPASGGTQVTITGTNFTGATTVDFGSTPATSFTVTSPTTMTATSPAGTGTVDVTVTNSAGTSATSIADLFAYGAPTVTAVSPNGGPASSTFANITITGTHFVLGATVNFGTNAGTAVNVISPTQLSVTAPTASAGSVDVTVTTPAGTSATSAADQYTYSDSVPAVSGLVTPAGPAAGGTSVVIDGYNLGSATAVKFGSTAATITANTATTVTATSPAGTSGSTVDVTVTTAGGTSLTSALDQFTYGPPAVTGVSPNSGPTAGGTTVTITGTGFATSPLAAADRPTVKFGTASVAAAKVTVNSLTSITVPAPAGTGTVDVTVTTKSGGTSATSPADQFTYAPTVTAVSPPSGPTAGGTSVTITGTGFTGATAVTFGSTASTSVTVNSPTSITATSPKGTAGTTDITVTTPAGTSATAPADQFFYGPPTVTAVGPNGGPPAGGTTVVITGTGFLGATAVKLGTTAASSFTVNSSTQITAVAPSGTGLVHITVTAGGGTSTSGGTANEFTYSNAPSVTSISPSSGPVAGGTVVVLTGTGFTGTTKVSFGTTATASYNVNSDTSLTVTSPAGTAGTVDITVSTANGTSATSSADQFTYLNGSPPTVTSVTPNAGSTAGGNTVVITGTGFVNGSTVQFGTVAAASVTVTNSTQITAVSPSESAGLVDITVTTPDGTSATSSSDAFTYSAGGAPGQGSLTVTNSSVGQNWNNLYMQITLSGLQVQKADGPNFVRLAYQDSSGDWCPLTLNQTSGTTFTVYFSGIGTSCGSAPGSFSLTPGASLTVPIQLSFGLSKYLGPETITATLYSGMCSSSTSCSQSGALNGSVVGSGTIQLQPLGRVSSPAISNLILGSSTVRQGFLLGLRPQMGGTPLPTGSLEFLVDGASATLVTVDGTAASNPADLIAQGAEALLPEPLYVDTAGFVPGTHTIEVQYSGDNIYAPSSLTEMFTVLPPPTGATLFTCNASGGQNGSASSVGYVTAAGSASASALAGTTTLLTDASVSVDFDPRMGSVLSLPTDVMAASASATFALSSGGPMTSGPGVGTIGSIDDVVTWSSMSADVPVTGDPGSTLPISVGEFGFTVNTPPFGTDTMTCSPASQPASLATITVVGNTLSASPSGGSAPGAAVTLTDTVAPTPASDGSQAGQYGQVTFYDGSDWLATVPVDASGDAGNGTASFTTSALALGDHQLTAQWSGTLNIPPNASNTVDYQVGTTSTTTLTSSANPANAVNPVTFTATVSGPQGATSQPTGDVSFTEDGNPITSCQNVGLSTATPPTATCKLSLPAGQTHAIVATYSGDTSYLGSSSDPLSQVTLPGTVTSILSTKDPSPPGNVTFWAGVAPAGTGATPTGKVAFSVDGKTLAACASQPLGSGGGASCTVSFKAGTTHKVFATYAGSASYSGSKSSTITQTVTGSKSSTNPKTTGGSATLASGKVLTAGQGISTGAYKLVMQGDGNLVEYQGSKALWASGTAGHPGAGVTMQKDGNLVIYFQGKAVWASKTAGHAGSHLTLQGSDGNVVIYTPSNKAVWATGT